ncbi:MAG: twin-arginine translocation signal domain-containing protein [Pyrinomonadaceae bacterium]
MTKADDHHVSSRRDFLKTSTAATVATTLATGLAYVPGAFAQGSDTIRLV